MAMLDGLLHCYTPSLGPTGYSLIDRGPRRSNGQFSNMSAASWQAERPNKWCLNFAGASNTMVAGCGVIPGTARRSVSIWWRTQVSLGTFGQRVAFSSGPLATGQVFQIMVFNTGTTTGATVTQNGDSFTVAAANDNVWHCIVCTNSDQSWIMYIDGVQVGSKVMSTTHASAEATIGGQPASYGGTGSPWLGQIGETAIFTRDVTNAEAIDIFRRGDGGIGRMLTGQLYRKARLSQAIGAAATPWLYAQRRSQIIGAGGVH